MPMKCFTSLIWKHCDVRWLSFTQTRQYGTESIVRVSFRSILPNSTAAASSGVLTEAPHGLFDLDEFEFCLFRNLYDGFWRSIRGLFSSAHQHTIAVLAFPRCYPSTIQGESYALVSGVSIPPLGQGLPVRHLGAQPVNSLMSCELKTAHFWQTLPFKLSHHRCIRLLASYSTTLGRELSVIKFILRRSVPVCLNLLCCRPSRIFLKENWHFRNMFVAPPHGHYWRGSLAPRGTWQELRRVQWGTAWKASLLSHPVFCTRRRLT